MQSDVTPDKSQCKSAGLEEKKKIGVEIDALFSAYATSGPAGRKPA